MVNSKKIVLVTGGASGIGAAVAVAFAKSGAEVILSEHVTSCRETLDAIHALGGTGKVIKADVSKGRDVNELVERIISEYGRLDVLFANAGIVKLKLVKDMSDEEWDETINMNVKSIFLCCRAALPCMIRQGEGKIICVSSSLGGTQAYPGLAHYSAAKAGIEGFVKCLALELAHSGVTINAIAPGPVRTRVQTKQVLDDLAKRVPFGRVAEPEDVASVAIFLASDNLKYMTGSVILLDGGLSLEERTTCE